MHNSLPVLNSPDRLDQIEIPIPCQVPWDSMAGDAQVRHCGQCRQNVYNIASMTRPEALRLLESNGGRVCVRIFRRPDGTIITADCRERLRQARQRGVLAFLAVLVLVVCAQVSAQIVGLIGLRRLVRGDAVGVRGEVALAGAPVPVPVPVPIMGEPPVQPLMGKPAPPPKPIRKVNKHAPVEVLGRMPMR
jgi:hypothetical protein